MSLNETENSVMLVQEEREKEDDTVEELNRKIKLAEKYKVQILALKNAIRDRELSGDVKEEIPHLKGILKDLEDRAKVSAAEAIASGKEEANRLSTLRSELTLRIHELYDLASERERNSAPKAEIDQINEQIGRLQKKWWDLGSLISRYKIGKAKEENKAVKIVKPGENKKGFFTLILKFLRRTSE